VNDLVELPQPHLGVRRNYDELVSERTYVQPDPIGLVSGVDIYAYVFENLLSRTDATGSFVPGQFQRLGGSHLFPARSPQAS
jgi:hypothetical protein